MKSTKKSSIQPLLAISFLLVLILSTVSFISKPKVLTSSSTAVPVVNTPTPTPDPPNIVIRPGVVNSKKLSDYVFSGCGDDMPNYKYSVRIPESWTVSKIPKYSSFYGTYYIAEGPDGKSLEEACVIEYGGDISDSPDASWTKFDIDGKVVEACFGKFEDTWKMGVLNVTGKTPEEPVVAFWADGMDKKQLNTLFSTFRRIGNK